MDAKDRLVVALDISDLQSACLRAELLRSQVGMFKIGPRLYTAHGPAAVKEVQTRGGIFLDLKYHDIPTTVEDASREAVNLRVDMFTVHCLGGTEMMRAARRGVKASPWTAPGGRPKVLGATILTSHDYNSLRRHGLVKGVHDVFDRVNWGPEDEAQRRFERSEVISRVIELAKEARDAGLDGVVVPPDAIRVVQEECGPNFLIVAVGIRQPGTNSHDHTSTMTPREAIGAGADYVVAGRPIIESHDPVGVTRWMIEEIAAAMAERR